MTIRPSEGREAEPGEVGELLVRTPKLMSGYWRQPEATAQAIRPCAETWVGWGEILGMGVRPRWNR